MIEPKVRYEYLVRWYFVDSPNPEFCVIMPLQFADDLSTMEDINWQVRRYIQTNHPDKVSIGFKYHPIKVFKITTELHKVI